MWTEEQLKMFLRYGLVLLDFNSGLQSIGFTFIQFHINITVKTESVVAQGYMYVQSVSGQQPANPN